MEIANGCQVNNGGQPWRMATPGNLWGRVDASAVNTSDEWHRCKVLHKVFVSHAWRGWGYRSDKECHTIARIDGIQERNSEWQRMRDRRERLKERGERTSENKRQDNERWILWIPMKSTTKKNCSQLEHIQRMQKGLQLEKQHNCN